MRQKQQQQVRQSNPARASVLGAFASLLSSALLSSCPSPTPPIEPVVNVPITIDGLAEVEDEALDGVVAARALAGDAVVKDDGASVSVTVSGAVVASDAIGRLVDAVAVDASVSDETRLIATSEGLFSLQQGTLARSPVDDVVSGVDLLASHTGALWLGVTTGDDAGVYRYTKTDLVKVALGGVSIIPRRLVAGAVVDGHLAAVVDDGSHLVALIETEGALSAREIATSAVAGLAVTGGGDVWFVVDGALHHRTPRGQQSEVLLPKSVGAVVDVAGAAGKPDLWIATETGLIHGSIDGAVASYDDAGSAVAALVAGGDGDVVVVRDVAAAPALSRLVAGRSVRFGGVVEAGLLDDGVVTTATVVALPQRLNATLEVSLDGAPSTSPPLALDPAVLFPGPHTLTATATYPDGGVVTGERVFFAGTRKLPTWNDEIRVIYDDVCARCHSPQGGAHLLDESDLWRGEIDSIINALDDGVMPPGAPLDEEQRRTIRLWRTTGMQE